MSRAARDPFEPLERLWTLLSLAAGVRSPAQLDAMLPAVAATAADIAGFECVAVLLHVRRGQPMRAVASAGPADRCAKLARKHPWTAPGTDSGLARRAGCLTLGASHWVALRDLDGAVIGALGASSRGPVADAELRVLAAVAASGAQALRRARAALEATRHRDALERLIALPAGGPVDALLQDVVDALRDALGFGSVAIRLSSPRGGAHAATGAPLTFPAMQPQAMHRMDAGDDLAVAVPLRIADGEPLGTLLAADHHGPPGGEDEIMHALALFAAKAATAVTSVEADAEAERLAGTDSLTGVGNRHAFLQRLEAVLVGPGAAEVGLLLCDLDGLKAINDHEGHAAGDLRLHALAEQLRATGEGARAAFRLGGDEFALVSPSGGAARARDLARSVDAALTGVGIGASIGWAVAGEGSSVDALLEAADTAMYRNKRRRRTGIALADPLLP